MKLIPLSELFDIYYGTNLELNRLEVCDPDDPEAIRFVSRANKNNGVVEYVKRIYDIEPNPASSISVAGGGTYVLSAFLQKKQYYSGRDLFYIVPKCQLSDVELLYYCKCISHNRYKYNYGRQANRTLKDILIPSTVPKEFSQISITSVVKDVIESKVNKQLPINVLEWKYYKLTELFDLKKGKRLTGSNFIPGDTPFVGAINSNNGWSNKIGQPPIFKGNVITVNYDGNGVGEAFYQPVPFWALDSVNVLYPKFHLNKYIGLFICVVIRKEKYRFSYGRKWNIGRMEQTIIKLPSKNGQPDFEFMENYIKSLPYSSSL